MVGLFIGGKPKELKKKVVVVGYGWAGKAFADNLDRRKYDLVIVAPVTKRLNQPIFIGNLSQATSTPSYSFNSEHALLCVNDTATEIVQATNYLKCEHSTQSYDYLVLATGSEVNFFGVPGAQEHAIPFKSEKDIAALEDVLPFARSIAIVGAGPTGVELACKIASMENINVSINEALPDILPGFSNEMRSKTKEVLASKKVILKTGTPITEVKDEKHLGNHTVWTAGIKPTALVKPLDGGKPLQTDETLRFTPSIYALGDIVGGKGPATAQNAKQQGEYLAKHFNTKFKEDTPYKYKEKGRLLDLTDTILVEVNNHVFQLPPLFCTVVHWYVKNS